MRCNVVVCVEMRGETSHERLEPLELTVDLGAAPVRVGEVAPRDACLSREADVRVPMLRPCASLTEARTASSLPGVSTIRLALVTMPCR